MKPVYQQHIHKGEGDCFSAGLASLLEIPLNAIPNFRKENPPPKCMMTAARIWLQKNFNLSIVTIQMEKKLETGEDIRLVGAASGTPCLAGGRSPNFHDTLHCVVGEIDEHGMNFVMKHDPNPSGKGLVGKPIHLYFLVPMNYAALTNYKGGLILLQQQMTLGEFLAALKRKDGALPVYFDFAYFQPYDVHSYRGDYSQLALGYKIYPGGENCTVEDLRTMLDDADGKLFTGYKGGEYEMTAETHVWVANPSESTGTAVVNVEDQGWRIVLITASIQN
jgi:hypothetical protein